MSEPTDPEDAKLVTLARSARSRAGSAEGAAVRDAMGRTYAAGGVDLSSLHLTAVQAAVAIAVASGSPELEAAALVGESRELAVADAAVLAECGVGAVHLAGPDGVVHSRR